MLILARFLIGFVAVVTMVGSNVSDWNRTHVFSELWSPHARMHGVWLVFLLTLLSILSLWLVSARKAQPDRSLIACLIQGVLWVSFFPALLVPGATTHDPSRALFPIFGIELNVYGAAANIIVLAAALVMIRRSRSSIAPPSPQS